MFIFIAGTSGSGKSSYAETRLSELTLTAQKIYIATANSEEMPRRVELHKARRQGKGFITIERPKNLGALEIPKGSCILIEALTTWLANEMFCGGDFERIYYDLQKLRAKAEHVILVSDYIFSDGACCGELTENYMKALGDLSVKFAAEADEVIECFAGLTLQYKPYHNI